MPLLAQRAAGVLVDRVLELLARLEARHVGGGDLDLLAGLGIAPLARLAFGDLEGPEADQQDLFLLLQRLGYDREHGVDGAGGVGLGQVGGSGDGGDQIVLVHGRAPAWSGSLKCNGGRKTASTLNTTFCGRTSKNPHKLGAKRNEAP